MPATIPTIADVARCAGVSTGTVSNVLSGVRYVRPETRERVETALAELDYVPNRIARALSQRRTLTVGMVVPDVTNPFFASLIRSVESALAEHGYAVVFGNASNDPETERRYLLEFTERGVDALVAATAGVDPAFLRRVHRRLPTLLVDRVIPRWPGDLVADDDTAGMAAVVDHLVGLGHRRIAIVDGDPALSTARSRHEAAQAALARHGLALERLQGGAFTIESGREQALELLRGPACPTAVVAGNDLLAMGVLGAAAELAIRVPGDLSVTGYDDITFAALVDPPLTTVRQPLERFAAEIVRLLLRRLERPAARGVQTLLAPQLVVRASSAAPGPRSGGRR